MPWVSRTSPVTVHTNPHEATSQRTKGTGFLSTGEGTRDRLLPYRTYSTRGHNCKTTGHLCAATTHRVDIECGGPRCQAPSLDQGPDPIQWMLWESRWAWYSPFDDFKTTAPSAQFRSKEMASFKKGQRQFENVRLTGFEFEFLSTLQYRAAHSELLVA